jgi:hypothetical protein
MGDGAGSRVERVGIDIEMVVVQACGFIAHKVEVTLYGLLGGFRFATRLIQCCVLLCPSCEEGKFHGNCAVSSWQFTPEQIISSHVKCRRM